MEAAGLNQALTVVRCGRLPVGDRNIYFANQPNVIIPHWQRARHAVTGTSVEPRSIRGLMHRLPTPRAGIFSERLLLMNERSLARAIHPMLERGEGDRV